jgi:hypothetical protein
MTWNEIRVPIAVGLGSALVIVVLALFDALPLALFIIVLAVGGLISAVGVVRLGGPGATPSEVESSSVDIDEFTSKKWRPPKPEPPPAPEDSRPEEDAGGAAAV